jgi:outer membrane protein TolC
MQPGDRILTLEEAINRALEANRIILDVRDGVERARLSIFSAESDFELKFIPLAEAGFTDDSEDAAEENYGAGISVQKKFSTGTYVTLEPNASRSGDIYQTRIDSSLSQPLLRGLSREYNLSGVRGAEFGARSARRSLYLTQVNTIISTVRAVYDVALQRKVIHLNEESLTRLKGHAEAARVKEKFGLATPIDVYRAEIELKQAEDNLATAREAYMNAFDNLKVILAFPPGAEIDISAPLKYGLVRMDEKEAVGISLRNRVELKQAWDAVGEAERRSRVAKHGILPELDVVLSFAPYSSGEDLNADLNEYVWGVSLSSSTDIKRTRERVIYDQSVLDANSARRNVSLLHDEVTREAKSALRALKKAEQKIDIQSQQIRTAENKLKLAQVKFKHGMASNFDLIEAEKQLRQAQTSMVSAVIDYIIGTYNLRAATGTLLEQEAGL